MNEQSLESWREALGRIRERAGAVDLAGVWPAESVGDLTAAGAMGWAVPGDCGGAGMDAVALHQRYEELCGACLTTGLVFTQRDAAVGFLVGASEVPIARRLLEQMARGEIFATIGISHLTTSRRHGAAAVMAVRAAGGYRVNGVVPWVTSLHHNRRVILGAVVEGGGQILVALDVESEGVALGEALKLASLTGSDTGEMRLKNVFVAEEDVLRGPCDNALAGRERGFGLATCVLPLGVAGGAIAQAEATARTEAGVESVGRLRAQHSALREEVYRIGTDPAAVQARGAELRARANSLAARASLAALELSKGSGFLLGQDAQRRVREAMFFFVWSSPSAVTEGTLQQLASDAT